jgi:hypothetical protein
MDLITTLAAIPGIGPAMPYILGAVALCAALAPFLPAPKSDAGVYAALHGVVNFVALNLGHAKNASAPNATPKPPGGVMLLLAIGLASGLSACTDQQLADARATNAKIVQAVGVFCQADAVVQPVLVPLAAAVATSVAPQSAAGIANAVALDQSVAHPDLQAACAAYGGKPVAVAPAK